MTALDATDLLDVWERGLPLSLPRRAVALLRAAWPGAPDGDVLDWPLGLRDARLLALRRRLFGPDLTLLTPCPSCGDAIESTFRVDDVLLPASREAAATPGRIERDGCAVTFRAPRSGDLLALAESPACASPSPRDRLLARCVVDVRDAGGRAVDLAAVPPALRAELARAMAARDPQADVLLACVCPACGGRWDAIFDIATVLWSEVHRWARQLLRDVHTLGRGYGWREADVLALSPTRRRLYVELLGS